ncbi:hypothetical protein HYT02_00955 [Candidatus Gottesmanbacteria bacterium]|nr:hypothetical protein [Candidatus Gottesmanbacteria bacterium]
MHYVLFDKLKDGKIVLFYGGYQDEKAQDGRAGYTPVSVHFAINNQTYDELIKEIRRGNWDVLPTFFEANAPNLMENPTQNRTGLRFVRSRNVAYVNHTSPQFDEWLNTEGRISKRYINAPYSGQAEVLSLMDNGFKNGVIVKGEYSKPFGAGIPYQPGS